MRLDLFFEAQRARVKAYAPVARPMTPPAVAVIRRRYTDRCKAIGRCVSCRQQAVVGSIRCERHRERHRLHQRAVNDAARLKRRERFWERAWGAA